MSSYYCFYIGKLNTVAKTVDLIGPKFGDKLIGFYSRSRSFVADDILDYMEPVPLSYIADKEHSLLCVKDFSGAYQSRSYMIPIKQLPASDYGLQKGYVTIDELDYLEENQYDYDSITSVRLLSPTVVAEMDQQTRNNYGQCSYVDTGSFDYVAGLAQELVSDLEFEPDFTDYVLICVIE